MASDWGTRTQNQRLSPNDSLFGLMLLFFLVVGGGAGRGDDRARACRQVWPQRHSIVTPHPAFIWSCFLNTVPGERQKERVLVTFTQISGVKESRA